MQFVYIQLIKYVYFYKSYSIDIKDDKYYD